VPGIKARSGTCASVVAGGKTHGPGHRVSRVDGIAGIIVPRDESDDEPWLLRQKGGTRLANKVPIAQWPNGWGALHANRLNS
jgi:hypothetical protein